MHGRVRVKTSAEKAKEHKEAEGVKIKHYVALKDLAFQKYRANILDQGALELTAQLLSLNPELCSFWNYRRQIILDMRNKKTPEEVKAIFTAELKLMEELIPQHSKSYWIWFHREWVTSKMDACDWIRELGLCTQLLAKDDRNFHCWNYRRYVAKNASVSLSKEFDFTTKKIEENFSNYSAWHQRSVLIPKIYNSNTEEYRKLMDTEFELIRNAFYTEPKDQSAWIYHRWLTTQVCDNFPPKEKEDILKRELEMCSELKKLLEMEEDQSLQKWPIFTSVFILQKLGNQNEKMRDNLDFLVKVDPTHQHQYLDLKNKVI